MTRLVRKCECGTLLVIDVGQAKMAHVYDWRGSFIEEVPVFGSYDEVECVEGCCLAFTLYGQTFSLPIINRTTKKAVYCKHCYSVRYLRLFKEIRL